MIAEKIFSLLQPRAFKLWRHSALYRPEIVRNKAYLVASKKFSDCEYVNIDSLKQSNQPYSLLTTVYNESKSIEDFLNSILRQSAAPNELVICDGGSGDNTIELIKAWQQKSQVKFPIRIIAEGKCSIAKGRNLSAKKASNDILLFADAGTSLDKSWAEKMLKGFLQDVDLVCGWYKPVIETNLQKAFAWFVLPKLNSIDPATFLPSGRSLAVRKHVFQAVGGFPEHLSFAGEDSLFAAYAKTASRAVAFVPDAYCYWRLPGGFMKMIKTVFRYAKGDGETGELFWNYYIVLIDKIGALFVHLYFLTVSLFLSIYLEGSLFFNLTLVLATTYFVRSILVAKSYGLFSKSSLNDKFYRTLVLKFALPAQFFGFWAGVLNRKEVESRRLGKRSNAVIFVPEYKYMEGDLRIAEVILSKYSEGAYLTIIAAKFIGNTLRNPSIENHLRSKFDLDSWITKHQSFIQGEIEFIDFCQDALSIELVSQFKSRF